MGIALLLAAALAWWLHKRGELVPNLLRLGGSAAAALLAIRMIESGRPLVALALAAAGAWWWVARRPVAVSIVDVAEARAVLGLSAGADAAAIRAAWRDQIARVHPDKGGTAALAAQVTAARDVLLRSAR